MIGKGQPEDKYHKNTQIFSFIIEIFGLDRQKYCYRIVVLGLN